MKIPNSAVVMVLIFLGWISFCRGAGAAFANFKGDERDAKAIEAYVRKYIDNYFVNPASLAAHSEKMEHIRLRRELQRLVLKIDAGDIQDKELRNKIVALRRAALANSNKPHYVIDMFEREGRNKTGGIIGAEYAGDVAGVSPWLMYEYRKEPHRMGKKCLFADYDIAEGSVALYEEIKRAQHRLDRYGSVQFDAAGTAALIAVQLIDDAGGIHEKQVRIAPEWQTIVILFNELSGQATFDIQRIRRIRFVLSPESNTVTRGSFMLNNLVYGIVKTEGDYARRTVSVQYTMDGPAYIHETEKK